MNRRFLFAKTAAFLAATSYASFISAQTERPVVVAYEAPPECGSREAFQWLLEAEIARSPNPNRPWRFAVRIEREGDTYEGTLRTETGVRTLRSACCTDITAAFAVIVAVADTETTYAPPTAPAPVVVVPVAPPAAVPASPSPPPPETPPRPASPATAPPEAPGASAPLAFRLGARPFLWSHGPADDYAGKIVGVLGVFSVELPWGLSKMMFDLGIGAAWSTGDPSQGFAPSPFGSSGYAPQSISYLIVDTQACPLDFEVKQTGLSLLGCLRFGGAKYTSKSSAQEGGALWGGPGARVRWQSPFSLFLEAGAALVVGNPTVGGANAASWAEVLTSLGFKF